MAKVEVIKLGEKQKEVKVRELTVEDILSLTERPQGEGEKLPLSEIIKSKMELFTDLKYEDAKKFTPSELKELYEKVKEVNGDFFDIMASLGLTNILTTVREAMMQALTSDFRNIFANSLTGDTDTETS